MKSSNGSIPRRSNLSTKVAAAAEASGAVGVPHLEWQVEDKSAGGYKTKGMFGREHLSLLRLQLHEQGLARRPGVEPHISHAWCDPAQS